MQYDCCGCKGFCGHPGWQLEQRVQFRFTHVKLVKRQSMIRQRRKLKHLLAHGEYNKWRQSQIAFMGHIRHGDGQNGLIHLGLAASC